MSESYVMTNAPTGRAIDGLRRMPLAEAVELSAIAHEFGFAGRILRVVDDHPGHAPYGLEYAPLVVWTRTEHGAEEHPYGLTTPEEQHRILSDLIARGVHVVAFRGL